MNKFTTHTGLAVPLYQANIDTDQIIPKQFLKSIKRTGFGANLFNDWRFNADGTPNEDFVLNKPKFEGGSILLAGKNFGCGSSREHAPWALEDYGFRVVISSAFADIFYNNCFKIGLLPIILPEEQVAELVKKSENLEDYHLTIDLENQKITDEQGFETAFGVDEFRKFCLINGLDDIGLTLQHADKITVYESNRPGWSNL
ncbi:MAG TPA: 3-isopropylmalate dehydratase small subunit [Pyrinomonadaceae bacterium]|nr:3-isopropylmalate dehydratase small subunit [Pyrinomonadaceae bacterium]